MGGSLGENGYMYMYGLVPLLCTLNCHNIVNRQYKIKFKILKIKSEHKHIGHNKPCDIVTGGRGRAYGGGEFRKK